VKALKTILVSLLTLSLIGAASAATTYLRITGSTAFRAATHTAIQNVLKLNGSYTFAYVGSSPTKANTAIFTQTISGNTTIIKTNFIGSVGGVATVTKLLTEGLGGNSFGGGGWLIDTTPQSTTGTQITSPSYDSPVTADVTLSDAFQASAPNQGGVNYQSPVLAGKIVGVVDFVWVKSVSASAVITNLTSANAKLLLGGTLTEDKFGGSSSVRVYAFGRDEDSGTRIAALADTGYGIHNTVQQYKPSPATGTITSIALWPATTVDGISYPLGDPGFSGGGAVASALLQTNGVANAEYIGYLGINDATTVGTANWLKFDGKPTTTLTAANIASGVENNGYSFWGYEHFLYRGSNFPVSQQLTGTALTVATRIQNQILNTDAGVSGIPISAMHWHRNSDGGTILSGGTPPNVP
jgi:hypothetical protein